MCIGTSAGNSWAGQNFQNAKKRDGLFESPPQFRVVLRTATLASDGVEVAAGKRCAPIGNQALGTIEEV
jgi:hypothetical protein